MKEKIILFEKSTRKGKKYAAKIKNNKTHKIRTINFGAKDYQQFKDRTPLKLYSNQDHGDKQRQKNYYNRFSGTTNRGKAIALEKKKSEGYYNAKILSHEYLW